MKRLLALFLALSLLFTLTACGKDKTETDDQTANTQTDDQQGGNQSNQREPSRDYGEFVYTAAYQKMSMDNVQSVNRITVANDRIYMVAWIITGKVTEYYDEEWMPVTDEEAIANGEYFEKYEYDETKAALCSMNLDGTGFQVLENFVPLTAPEGSEGESYINAFIVDQEGCLWICEELYAYHFDEEGTYFDDGTQYTIRKLDATGAELLRVDLSAITAEQEYFYVNSMVVDDAGTLYLCGGSENAVYIIDQTGAVKSKLPVENWVQQLIQLKDGTVAALLYEEGYVLKPIDTAAGSFGEGIRVSQNMSSLLNGGGDYDFYYNDNLSLYGFRVETGETEQLINWIDSDINSFELNHILPMEDGRILALSSKWDETVQRNAYELVTLTKADPATIPEKIMLTYACMWLDYDVRSRIIEFNKTNELYRINVVDYSVYNTEDDYEAGLTKLSTEIISGQVPDLLAVDGLPIQRYIARGVIEDLTPWIESDPELGPDALVPGARNALSYNGGIYQAASTFYATTVVGPASVVGDEPGWTMAELQAALQNCPPGTQAFANMTRESMLRMFCMMNQENYVNWATGECSFDNEEFVRMLEFVNTFPVEINYDDEEWVSDYRLIREGKVLLYQCTIADFQEFQIYDHVYGTDVTFIGYPTVSGNGAHATINTGLAMSSTCADKEAAWSFLRYLFTEEYQTGDSYYGWGFPTNQKAFDKVVAEAMEIQTYIDENGNEVPQSNGTWWLDEGMEVEIFPPTQEQVDMLVEILNGVGSAVSFDQDIYDIIAEEAQYFFEGQKTAQDVAGIIQSRVKIYVNEQR